MERLGIRQVWTHSGIASTRITFIISFILAEMESLCVCAGDPIWIFISFGFMGRDLNAFLCHIAQPGPEAESNRVMQRWGSDGGDGDGGGGGYGDGGGGDEDDEGGTYGSTLRERLGIAKGVGNGGAMQLSSRSSAAASSGQGLGGVGSMPAHSPLTPSAGRRQAQLLSGDRVEWTTPRPQLSSSDLLRLGGPSYSGHARSPPPAHGSPGAGSPLWASASSKLLKASARLWINVFSGTWAFHIF